MITMRVGTYCLVTKRWRSYPTTVPPCSVAKLVKGYEFTRRQPLIVFRISLPNAKKVYIWKGKQISFELARQLIYS